MTVGIVLRIAEFVYWCPVIFFVDDSQWSWGQGAGINAGVMLMEPDIDVLSSMLTSERCLITSASQLQEKHGQTTI